MPGMYDEYLSEFTKYAAKYGEKTALFYEGGIFYELYDAIYPETGRGKTTMFEVADFLGIRIAVHKGEGPGGLDGHVAGIPNHVVHKWAARLTAIGWVVVVMNQEKNAAGKIIGRKLDRVLTPGSHIEAAGTRDCFLSFVCVKKGSVGEAAGAAPALASVALDLSTGHLHTFETQATGTEEAWTSNEMVQFMELYPPREVLWSVEGGRQFLEALTESKFRSILGVPAAVPFHRREVLGGAWEKAMFREDYLRDRCQIRNLLPTGTALGLVRGSQTETALLSLLNALEELWPSLKLGALLVYPWVPGTTLRLGENALVQLHMLVPGDSNQDVLSIFDCAATPMGTRGLRERLLKPSAEAGVIRERLAAVEHWFNKRADYKDAQLKRLRKMADLSRIYRRLQQGTLTAMDILNLHATLTFSSQIAADEEISEIAAEIGAIQAKLFKVFSREKALEASEDKHMFATGINPEMDTLESYIKSQHYKIQGFVSQLVGAGANLSPDTFKVEFREKSLIIKGPRGALQNIKQMNRTPKNANIVQNKTGSYVESPELDHIFATLSKLREQLAAAQAVTLIEQGSVLASQLLDSWLRVTDWITNVDVNLTLARVAEKNGYVCPTIADSPEEAFVEITGLRHPLLELQDRRIPYVQHDVRLGGAEKPGWLLYGLNASGKSSLMRAVGLSVLLAQAGSFVPTRAMRLAPFTSLHTRIINTDNLWMGLSSFAVEMSEMRDIFRDAGRRSLVLGDELCSGTETTSATALVAAGLRGLLKRGAKFLFATHLHGLAQIPEISTDSGLQIWHLHVEYDPVADKLIYHRTLRQGSGSALYGLEVAKAMRIPADILEDAIRFRKLLAGEADLNRAIGSSWNSAVIRRVCERCRASEAEDLEVHHIQPRRLASGAGRLADGSSVHATSNLMVLCDKCHDELHAGAFVARPMIQTSDGYERSETMSLPSQPTATTETRASKWSAEDQRTIQEVMAKYPFVSCPQLSVLLLEKHKISISASTLRKMRA
jgi:DNA mismatch repair protein MutS